MDPGKESLEEGLLRELREELGTAAGEIRLRPRHHRGARAWPGSGRREKSGSDVGLVTHFYIRRLRLEELVEIERGEKAAQEHGLEVGEGAVGNGGARRGGNQIGAGWGGGEEWSMGGRGREGVWGR